MYAIEKKKKLTLSNLECTDQYDFWGVQNATHELQNATSKVQNIATISSWIHTCAIL
jgi:hypothetical protein